jgi:hypothetical protein
MADTLILQKTAPVDLPAFLNQEEQYTILHCETHQGRIQTDFGLMNFQWVTVTKTTSLVHRKTNERLALFHAINIPVDPEKYWFKYPGERLPFTLIYPKIPEDWSSFDFVGDPDAVTEVPAGHIVSGWLVKNIKRNKSGIYRIKLR